MFGGDIIEGPLLVQDVLYDNALVMIKEKEETDGVDKQEVNKETLANITSVTNRNNACGNQSIHVG